MGHFSSNISHARDLKSNGWTSPPVIDVDIGKDDGSRSLAFVTLRQHFALRLVKSVLSLDIGY